MKFDCKIKAKHNYKKIQAIQKKLPQIAKEMVEDILKNIQTHAIRLENGRNGKGILVELIETSTMTVKGKVYADPNQFLTDKGESYLWFEYFGTGAYAEQEHIGKTEHFIESGYVEWYIPVNKVGRNLNYPIITIRGVQFYVATGAKANHFLGDAEFKTREENIELAKNKLKEMFTEVCK